MHRKTSEYIVDKITVRNVPTFYQIAKLNNLTSLAEISCSYIERCFAMVVESENFMELDFNLIAKIFASSELSVHSELEVFDAVTNWLKYDKKERSEFAKQLLLTVRFSLFSDHALKSSLDTILSFNENNECVDILNEVLVKTFTVERVD